MYFFVAYVNWDRQMRSTMFYLGLIINRAMGQGVRGSNWWLVAKSKGIG